MFGGLALAGCGLLPVGGPAIHLDNMTSSPMAVHVQGAWVGTYAPGTSVDVPLAGLGGPPYRVSVQSPSGQIVMQLEVSADDVKGAADNTSSSSGSADLPCGAVRVSVGRILETMPPVPFAQLPPCP